MEKKIERECIFSAWAASQIRHFSFFLLNFYPSCDSGFEKNPRYCDEKKCIAILFLWTLNSSGSYIFHISNILKGYKNCLFSNFCNVFAILCSKILKRQLLYPQRNLPNYNNNVEACILEIMEGVENELILIMIL